MKRQSLQFFTSATGIYSAFIPIYALFAAHHNPNASFEFLVRNKRKCISEHEEALTKIKDIYKCKVLITKVLEPRFSLKHDNSLRFTHTPTFKTDYVYIGDIDLLIYKNVMDGFKKIIEKDLPYCNQLRAKNLLRGRRLTGLHFCKYDAHYPLPKLNDLKKDITDERLLYMICKRKGILYKDIPKEVLERGRPSFSVGHLSLNRFPFYSGPDWEITKNIKLIKEVIKFIEDKEELITSFHQSSRTILFSYLVILKGLISQASNQKDYNLLIEKWQLGKKIKTNYKFFLNS